MSRWKLLGIAIACALGLSLSATGQAQPGTTPLLVAADLRSGTDLSGQWHYSIDPYRAGVTGFHGDPANASERRWAEVDVDEAMREDGRALFEYDMDSAPLTTLPASWLTHAPEMRHYQGLVWYQRRFEAAPQPGKRMFLRFGAANYKTQVYLNGALLGEHEGGFTPFAFEVTDRLRDGENQITVGVDSVVSETSVPPPVTDWENYGGITRAIRLIETPDTYVDDAWVRMTRAGALAIDARLDGPDAAGKPIRLVVPELGISHAGVTDASGNWRTTLTAPRALERWSPERPKLYDVVIEAGDDRWRDRIGFRTVEAKGAEILLNGEPIFLRGISMHEEELGVSPARAMTPAAARALLAEAKNELHANFVRLAHYPHDETVVRAADELGLLVWSEVPVYWRIAWNDPATLATARRMIAENILRDRNRASVVIWSIANETPITEARNAFLATLAADVRRLDDTRLVGAALLTDRSEAEGHPVMTMTDPLAAQLDVMGVNTYNGWYGGDRLADLPSIEWRIPADKPLILSELGAGAKAGFHDPRPSPQKFSEEYQAEYYRQTLAMAARIPNLSGLSPWIFKDFRSPRRQNAFQQGWNLKGLMSETGQHKLAFDVLADFYRDREASGN